MAKFMTVAARVGIDLYELIQEQADNSGMTISEWLTDAIDSYLDDSVLTWDELDEMSWKELVELADDPDSGIDSDDFKGGLFERNDYDGLMEAIATWLNIEIPEEEPEEV